MELCTFHPNISAIEHCEVCQRPLCGICLWYTDDGHRLCVTHAKEREVAGEEVLPPETYAEAVGNSLVRKRPAGSAPTTADPAPYRANSQDLNALLAAVIAVTTLFSCMGGAYCLPIVAFVLGIAGYMNAPTAVDPQRTRLLSGISLGVSGFMLLAVLAYIGFFVLFFILMIFTSGLP